MASVTQYNIGLISVCDWAQLDEVAYSNAAVDHPFVPGPGAPYDTVDIYRTWGRHPDTGFPLWVDEPATTRRAQTVVEHGITSMSSDTTPPLDNPIAAAFINAGNSDDVSLIDLDEDVNYLVWGVAVANSEDELPPALMPWAKDSPVTAERKTEFSTFTEARGVAAQDLIDYWDSHANATYSSVAEDFGDFL